MVKQSLFFAIFLILVIVDGSSAAADLSFIVLGDWGSNSEGGKYAETQLAVAKIMGQIAAKFSTHFVVTVGDNFYETGVSSPTDSKFVKDFVSVYTSSALQTPWFISLGNHDYEGIVQAQLDYHGDSRWHLPSRNYSVYFPVGSTGVTLVFLDTSPFISDYYAHPENPQMKIELANQHWEEQQAWLNKTLAEARAKHGNHYILVFGHHPVYTAQAQGSKLVVTTDSAQNDMQARVDPLLVAHNVSAYICGHAHNLQHVAGPKLDYFISGAGSRVALPKGSSILPDTPLSAKFFATVPGFQLVQMDKDKAVSSFYNHEGKVIYTATTPRIRQPVQHGYF